MMNVMNRRRILQAAGGIVGLGVLGATPVAAGRNDNRRRRSAEPVALEPGDVVAQTADPSASNFDTAFTFWRVDHGVSYSEAEYREPARTGPDVYNLGGYAGGSFWFGVSAPDDQGIQHKIDHTGQVAFYMRDSTTGEWRSLKAQFNGKGDLLHVNGVEPV